MAESVIVVVLCRPASEVAFLNCLEILLQIVKYDYPMPYYNAGL